MVPGTGLKPVQKDKKDKKNTKKLLSDGQTIAGNIIVCQEEETPKILCDPGDAGDKCGGGWARHEKVRSEKREKHADRRESRQTGATRGGS
jgi:hypothetical protein